MFYTYNFNGPSEEYTKLIIERDFLPLYVKKNMRQTESKIFEIMSLDLNNYKTLKNFFCTVTS